MSINSKEIEYDVCIVGSGPAGMVLCAELFAKGVRNICVLESGGQKRGGVADSLKKVITKNLEIREDSRERVFGGTSDTWTGQYALLDEEDFEKWPIPHSEMMRFYIKASENYGLPSVDAFNKKYSYLGDNNLSDFNLEQKTFIVEQPALQFGKQLSYLFNNEDVHLFTDSTVVRVNTKKSELNSDVVDSLTVCGADSVERNVYAKKFILAAGAIENTRILLNSKDSGGVVLGNKNDQLGRFFMNRIKGYAGLIVFKKRVLASTIPFLHEGTDKSYKYIGIKHIKNSSKTGTESFACYARLEADYPWTHSIAYKYYIYFFKLLLSSVRNLKQRKFKRLFIDTKGLVAAVPKLLLHLPIFFFIFSQKLYLGKKYVKTLKVRNFVEIPPERNNRITLSETKDRFGVPYPVAEYDLAPSTQSELKNLHDDIASYFSPKADFVIKDTEYSKIKIDSSHHLGGTVMGVNPTDFVVDADLKVHEVDNLFVVGGSVFPASGIANPTYTIIALAIRLAEHIESVSKVPALPKVSNIKKKINIIGAGYRVLNDVVPALEALTDVYEIQDIFAIKSKKIFSPNQNYSVKTEYTKSDIQKIEFLYIAVTAKSLILVLDKLIKFDCSHVTVIIDTPTPNLGKYVKYFRTVLVAEDSVYMPWLDLVEVPKRTVAIKSLYAFHGIALLKKIHASRIVFGVNVFGTTLLWFKNGTKAKIVAPRDYATGRLFFFVPQKESSSSMSEVKLILEKSKCVGFSFNEKNIYIDKIESKLIGECSDNATAVSKMLDIKRVGLYRMLKKITNSEETWTYDEGLNDSTVDTFLNRVGIYIFTR